LEAADQVEQSVERQLGRLLGPSPANGVTDVAIREQALSCAERWRVFCQTVTDNIDFALRRDMRVLVIAQPIWRNPLFGKPHEEQQREMIAMIQERYGSNPAVRLIDLRDAIDMTDQTLAYDQLHLTPVGSERLASLLVDPLMDMLTELIRERP
jgi:hypothetical protein